MKLKTIHIHSDYKFISNTNLFEGDYFLNYSLLIRSNNFKSIEDERVQIFHQSKEDFDKIINLCNNADLVVLYDLDPFKIKIALSLDQSIKIAWRFFGYELYRMRPDLFKSELSRKYDYLPIKKQIRKVIRSIFYYFTGVKSKKKLLKEAYIRINYFLALSEHEYIFLKNIWPELPIFIKLPHFHLERKKIYLDFESKLTRIPIIIIGNNRSSYNNHLDILKLIESYENKVNYNFTLFFNYGSVGEYANAVIKSTLNKSYYTVVDKFLSKEEFGNYYYNATALVINGYRQMAGANIRTALEYGVKVYLNNKNVYKQFLEDQGFIIFSLEDFQQDLKNNNLAFDEKSALHNIDIFHKFAISYTKEDFQDGFIKILRST